MFDLFKAFSNDSRKSKSVAKERLKLVLVHDRVDCSPQLLDLIKNDILKVIANYAEIEESGLEIKMSKCRGENEEDTPISALVANIPLKSIKDRSRQ
ncbi:MAG: cell division topological specificity factor MinE [Clostridioides sp.]|nr:cell division topological specificity factor MinE [Clostridioides sp.]